MVSMEARRRLAEAESLSLRAIQYPSGYAFEAIKAFDVALLCKSIFRFDYACVSMESAFYQPVEAHANVHQPKRVLSLIQILSVHPHAAWA
jgi:hypothetical protein